MLEHLSKYRKVHIQNKNRILIITNALRYNAYYLLATYPPGNKGNRFSLLKRDKKTKLVIDDQQQEQPQDIDEVNDEENLHCAQCKFPITRKKDKIEIYEKHEHVFTNPHGFIYRIGCFAQAPGCIISNDESSYFSWFPGYTWRIVVCGQCWTLLGWAFRSKKYQFFGLILDKLK